MTLQPEDEGSSPFASDEEIIWAWRRKEADLCHSRASSSYTSPQQVVAQTQAEYARIVVTTGPLSQDYQILGNVHADTRGVVNLRAIMNDALFRSRLAASIQATPNANNEQMNQLLRQQAVAVYGSKVNAIINVAYRVEPSGEVAADGLAVTFPGPPAVSPSLPQPVHASSTVEDRLDRLKFLLDQGLINKDEYKRRRSQVLQGL